MSILIKGITMPSGLAERGIIICGDGRVYNFIGTTIEGCYAVEVPTPHGRLIDADALYKTYQEICSDIACTTCPFLKEDRCEVEQMIMYAPTIIEAEEGKSNE